MKFKKLAEYWQKIEKTQSRLEMTEILAQVFRKADKEEIDQVVYLSLGRLRPKFEGVEFKLKEKMMFRVIAVASEKPVAAVASDFKKTGDLGTLITNYHLPAGGPITNKNLSVAGVYQRLMAIALDEGEGSQERKVNNMARLLKDLDALSAKFVVRIPVNKLRLGFSDMTILDGLSWMEKGNKSLRPDLERAFNVCADIGLIAKEFKSSGLPAIQLIKAKLGVPIRPAKAERLPSSEKIVEKLKVFGVEGKWDGLRVQIHLEKGQKVRIFSRNLDNMTEMFPDIVQAAQRLPVKSVILDGEAVCFNPKTGRLLPFQETVQRKRKYDVANKAKELPMKVFVYDTLLLDGVSLIDKTFRERRKLLEKILADYESETLKLAEQAIVSQADELKALLTKYLKMGLEGVMCKKLTEPYQAGARNFNWVKLKKTSQGELADTLDCVVMGYYFGKGKRTGFGIGAFLVGLPDDQGKIGSIAKIGTGLSDEQWKMLHASTQNLKLKTKPEGYLVNKSLDCDVWIRPEMVVEIMADEITKSPIHAFGLALRFPRLVRFRDDKTVSEATSRREFTSLFRIQKT